jgi:plastocyanin
LDGREQRAYIELVPVFLTSKTGDEMTKLPILAAMTVCAVAASAWAASLTVEQRGRSFGVAELAVQVGDSVTFINNDIYGHNVYSDTEGAVFDIGLQEPGETRDVTFEEAVIAKVRCRIHPRMRLQVSVTE